MHPVPYGVFDTEANRGFVAVGTSHETPLFAVDSIAQWWKRYGRSKYSKADELLILADCGGGNSARSHAWKYHLQHQLCNVHGLTVTVCHYPPGASKWNPIEHHLFSHISYQLGRQALGELRDRREVCSNNENNLWITGPRSPREEKLRYG